MKGNFFGFLGSARGQSAMTWLGIGIVVAATAMVSYANALASDAQLTFLGAEYREVRWSPDGKSLAIVMRASPQSAFRVAVISADGGEPRWITPESPGAIMPRWSPDGREVAFLTTIDNERRVEPKTTSVETGQVRTISVLDVPLVFIPGYTWTRDSKGFHYFSVSTSSRGHHTLASSGTDQKTDQKTVGAESIPEMSGVEWAADLSRIVFTGMNHSIFVAGPHGESPRQVLKPMDALPTSQPYFPSLSPDGGALLYSFLRKPTSGPTLWSIRVDGTNARSLASDGIRGQFSPDGQWIAYVDTRGVNTAASPSGSSFWKRVCKARLDGSGVVVLTK